MKSFSLFTASLLFLTLSILYISCEREYSYEGGSMGGIAGGTAVYTLVGAGGNCTAPVINGSYITGISLQSSNNIQLQVNVTTIGTYAVSTNIANGIQFSTAGNFTVTGLQTIRLIGNGTPLSAGTFPYNPPVSLGCAFFVTFSNPGAQVASFTLQGAPGTCSNFKINGMYTPGLALTSANTVQVIVNVTSIGSYSITTATIDGISFSQSGNFTVTGIQKVILKGSGTPSNPNFLTFTPNTGSSACTFSLDVLTLGSPATFVLESNIDHTCTGYSVSGTYFSGDPLTSTNTMVVKVTVTVLGNFMISTHTVNGMTFSNAGNFVSLGSQIVVLTGSGTPVSKGTFTFTPQIIGPHPIGGETCTADISVL